MNEGNCKNKKWFGQRKFAKRKAKLLLARGGIKTEVYKCPVCSGYHLTTKIDADYKSKHRRMHSKKSQKEP